MRDVLIVLLCSVLIKLGPVYDDDELNRITFSLCFLSFRWNQSKGSLTHCILACCAVLWFVKTILFAKIRKKLCSAPAHFRRNAHTIGQVGVPSTATTVGRRRPKQTKTEQQNNPVTTTKCLSLFCLLLGLLCGVTSWPTCFPKTDCCKKSNKISCFYVYIYNKYIC